MTRYVKGHQWSRDLLIVSMTIRLCQNHIESIVGNIYDKLEQKFVSVTVCVWKYYAFFLKDTYVLIGTKRLSCVEFIVRHVHTIYNCFYQVLLLKMRRCEFPKALIFLLYPKCPQLRRSSFLCSFASELCYYWITKIYCFSLFWYHHLIHPNFTLQRVKHFQKCFFVIEGLN